MSPHGQEEFKDIVVQQTSGLRMTPAAVDTVQTAFEAYGTQLLYRMNLLAMHRGCQTVSLRDFRTLEALDDASPADVADSTSSSSAKKS